MAQIISQNHDYYESCHNLDNSTGRVAFAAAGKGGWHKLGTVVDEAMTSEEALSLGALADWRLEKLPQYVDIAGENGEQVRTETGTFAVVRRDTGQVLTHGKSVGKDYTIVSNEELFEFLDAVLPGVGARYDTVGALGRGESVWLSAIMPDSSFTIGKDDRNESYLFLSSAHDGSGAIIVAPISQRVVCQNTHRVAMRQARGSNSLYRMKHCPSISDNIEAAKKALGLVAQSFAVFAEQAEAMSKRMLAPGALFDSWLDATTSQLRIADVVVSSESLRDGSILAAIDATENRDLRVALERQYINARDKRQTLYDNLMTRYESETCQTGAPGSLWAAYNAITEEVDHGSTLKYRGDEVARAENRFNNILLGKGSEWKLLALDKSLELLAV